MQKKKTITHIIQLGGSVRQAFNPKYLTKEGQLENPLRDFVKKLHKDLEWLENTNFLQSENNYIKKLLMPWKKERITDIKNILCELENGTFTFYCVESKCTHHPTNKGFCDADLMEEKLRVKPGACNCATFREQKKEYDLSQVFLCKSMTKVG